MPNCYALLRVMDDTWQTMRYGSYKKFYSLFLVDAALFSGPKICWLKTPWLDVMSNFWGSDKFN
jgi:hypothetical protein